MLLLRLVLVLLSACSAVERRDRSLTSSLVSYVLQRSNYKTGDTEYSRVTQAPIVKVHLHKTFLPATIHSSLKSNLAERLLERKKAIGNYSVILTGASDIEHENNERKDLLLGTMASLDELERLSGKPLHSMNSHNFREPEFQALFSAGIKPRQRYQGIMNEPIGLSDYAVLNTNSVSNPPGDYSVLERQKFKPSEMEEEDTERMHMPTFTERGDRYVKATRV